MPNIFQPQPLGASDLAPLTKAPPEIDYNPQQTDQAFASAKAIGDSMGQAFTPLLPQNRLANELKNQTNILHQNSLKKMPAGTDLLGAQTVQNYASIFGAPLTGPDGMYDVPAMEKRLSDVATQKMDAEAAVMRAKANPWRADSRTDLAMTKALESVGISVPPTSTAMEKWSIMQQNPAALDTYHQFLQSVGATSGGGGSGGGSGAGTPGTANRAAAAMITKEAPLVNMATAANETMNLGTASQIFEEVGAVALKSNPKLVSIFNAVPGIKPEDRKIQVGYLATKWNMLPEGPQKEKALKALGVWATAKNVLRVDMPNMMNPGKSATDEDMKAYDRDYFNLDFELGTLGKTTDTSFKQQLESTLDLIKIRTGSYSLLIPKPDRVELDLGSYYFGANNRIGQARLTRYGEAVQVPQGVLSPDGKTDQGALRGWLDKTRGASVEIVPLNAQEIQAYNAASRQPGFSPAQQVSGPSSSTTRNGEEIVRAIQAYRQNPNAPDTSFNRLAKGLGLLQSSDVTSLPNTQAGGQTTGVPQVGETWNWKDAKGTDVPYTLQPDGSWQPAASVAPAPQDIQSKVGQLLGVTPGGNVGKLPSLPVPTNPGKPLANPVTEKTNAQKASDVMLGISGGGNTTTWDKW